MSRRLNLVAAAPAPASVVAMASAPASVVAAAPVSPKVAAASQPLRRRALVLAVMVGVATLMGCGGDRAAPAGSSPSEDGVVRVVGTDDLRFEPVSLQVPSGTELELVCEPAVNHNLVIVETGQEIAVCQPGGTASGSLDVEPGDYTYLCTVPGHSATMRGELTVTDRSAGGERPGRVADAWLPWGEG